jgi:hypothetical protein
MRSWHSKTTTAERAGSRFGFRSTAKRRVTSP